MIDTTNWMSIDLSNGWNWPGAEAEAARTSSYDIPSGYNPGVVLSSGYTHQLPPERVHVHLANQSGLQLAGEVHNGQVTLDADTPNGAAINGSQLHLVGTSVADHGVAFAGSNDIILDSGGYLGGSSASIDAAVSAGTTFHVAAGSLGIANMAQFLGTVDFGIPGSESIYGSGVKGLTVDAWTSAQSYHYDSASHMLDFMAQGQLLGGIHLTGFDPTHDLVAVDTSRGVSVSSVPYPGYAIAGTLLHDFTTA